MQPAAGDAGGSLGATLAYWHHELEKPRVEFKDKMKGSYLGPKFKNELIEQKQYLMQTTKNIVEKK